MNILRALSRVPPRTWGLLAAAALLGVFILGAEGCASRHPPQGQPGTGPPSAGAQLWTAARPALLQLAQSLLGVALDLLFPADGTVPAPVPPPPPVSPEVP